MNIYKSPQILKHLPNATSYLCRKLLLIQYIYAKYKKLKDEITNKQIQYMIANDGIFSGELEPNPEAYLRQYNTIIQQSQAAQSLLVQNEETISQCLDCIDQLLEKLSLSSNSVDTITQEFQQNANLQPQSQKSFVQEEDPDDLYQQKQVDQSISQTKSEKNLKSKYKSKERQKHRQMNNKYKTKVKTKYGSQAKSKCKSNSKTKYPSKSNSKSKSKYRQKQNNEWSELQKQKKNKGKSKSKAKTKAKTKSGLNLIQKYRQGTYIRSKQANLQKHGSSEENSSSISINIES